MCGIAGALFHFAGDKTWGEQAVTGMLHRIGHRGFRSLSRSDVSGHACLGCVRLPICDPIAGIQPAFNADRTVTALLNGEIYNFDQFRNLHAAPGNSDAALLPFIYRESATQQPNKERLLRCRGMFAIVLHDLGEQPEKVMLLRDHVGIKPLFLAEVPQGLLVASETKAFLDENLISLREIKPGELVTIAYDGARWEIVSSEDVRNSLRSHSGAKFNGHPGSIRDVVSRAVASQWPGEDLPVSVLCSGGIDSSIVAFELSKHRTPNQPLVAYAGRCIDAKSASSGSDAIAARRVCQAFEIPLREVEVSYDDLFNVIADVIYHVETFEPNVVRNAAIQFHIMRQIAADGFRVAFCGEGADELFWGYADFAAATRPDELSRRLLDDLHRTQLQRVDRMAMAHTVEVRVPFLDETVVQLALGIPADQKRLTACGVWLGKAALREAYADVLPDEIVLRRKATMAFGAGFGGVEMNDPMMNSRCNALLQLRGETVESVRAKFPAYLSESATPERALYLQIFSMLGFQVPMAYFPPTVAQMERA